MLPIQETKFQTFLPILLDPGGWGSLILKLPVDIDWKDSVKPASADQFPAENNGVYPHRRGDSSVPRQWIFPGGFQVIQAGIDRDITRIAFHSELAATDDFPDFDQRQFLKAGL